MTSIFNLIKITTKKKNYIWAKLQQIALFSSQNQPKISTIMEQEFLKVRSYLVLLLLDWFRQTIQSLLLLWPSAYLSCTDCEPRLLAVPYCSRRRSSWNQRRRNWRGSFSPCNLAWERSRRNQEQRRSQLRNLVFHLCTMLLYEVIKIVE